MTDSPIDWWCETLRNIRGASRFAKPVTKLPTAIDSTFYYTWILFDPMRTNRKTWQGIYWTPWIIFDIDNSSYDLMAAHQDTLAFVNKLITEYEVPENALRIIFSTSKGFHVYLDSRVIDLKPSATLHSELMAFAKDLLPSTDMTLYAKRHVIGLPNSRHKTTGLYYLPLTIDSLRDLTVEHFLQMARATFNVEIARSSEVAVCSKLLHLFLKVKDKPVQGTWGLPGTKELINSLYTSHPSLNGMSEGGRNNGMFRLACHYRDKMLSKEETIILCTYSNSRSVPPLPEKEMIRHVNQAYKRVER